MIREAIIVMGYQSGISNRELAEALSLEPSAVSKRREAARGKPDSSEMRNLLKAMRVMV